MLSTAGFRKMAAEGQKGAELGEIPRAQGMHWMVPDACANDPAGHGAHVLLGSRLDVRWVPGPHGSQVAELLLPARTCWKPAGHSVDAVYVMENGRSEGSPGE